MVRRLAKPSRRKAESDVMPPVSISEPLVKDMECDPTWIGCAFEVASDATSLLTEMWVLVVCEPSTPTEDAEVTRVDLPLLDVFPAFPLPFVAGPVCGGRKVIFSGTLVPVD